MKKLICIGGMILLMGSTEIFAQSGNEPQLTAGSINKKGAGNGKPVTTAKPELAAAKSNNVNAKDRKALNPNGVEHKPQLAAGENKNGTLYPVKK